MKLVKITSYYKFALKYYYNQNPEITKKSYKEQYSDLMSFRLGWSDFYTKALGDLGLETHEIVYNAEFLQKKWAEENKSSSSALNLVLEQFQKINPDIIWFQDSFSFPEDFLKILKSKIPNLKILIGNCCSPYTKENLKTFSLFDFVTTCSPVFVESFNENNIKNLLLYHAFEKEILNQIKEEREKNDLIFIGSIIPRKGFHHERKKFLEKIAEQKNLDFQFYGNLYNTKYPDVLQLQLLYILKQIIKISGIKINSTKLKKVESISEFTKYYKYSKEIKKAYLGPKYGIDMYKALANSKITFDIQGEIGGNYAATMRLFEATGVGTLLIEENKKNIPDIFLPDKEIITFDNYEEALDKILYFIEHQDEALEISKAGQQRTLKDHTYFNRAQELLKEINKMI